MDFENKKYKMKIAVIAPWLTSCGISTYTANFVNELAKLSTVRVFAEKNGNQDSDSGNVQYCWDRYLWPSWDLIDRINQFNPDVVHLQHEFGFYSKAYQFTSLVSYLRWKKYKVVTTFHSVYNHLDKTVTENAAPNIIVHTNEGRDILISKGILAKKIHVIPHGAKFFTENNTLIDNLWNTWQNEHTIFQPGFLFYYKGHLKMLDIVKRLKEKYSDVHYIIQGSENANCQDEHDKLYNDIYEKARKLDILDNITVNRGFISHDVLLNHIRTVKCCVLPYMRNEGHETYSASGASKIVLATKTPLVVSDAHLFDDVKYIALYSKDENELYENIEKVFDKKIDLEEMYKQRTEFIEKTSWKNIALQTIQLYNSI